MIFGALLGRRKIQRTSHDSTIETKAKISLRGAKGKGLTYANLVEKLAEIGVSGNERNLNNKISRGGFTAAFLIHALRQLDSSRFIRDV